MTRKTLLKSSVIVLTIVSAVILGKVIVTKAVEPPSSKQASTAKSGGTSRNSKVSAARPAPSTTRHATERIITPETGNWMRLTGSNLRGAVSPVPGHMVVEAQGHLYNSMTAPRRYRWYLQVYREGRPTEVVKEFGYDEQAFFVPPREAASPTFFEEIPLPPGRFTAFLQLQEYADFRSETGEASRRFLSWAGGVVTQEVR